MQVRTSVNNWLLRYAARPLAGRQLLIFVLVAAGSIVAGWIILENLLLPRGLFSFDEASHALKGALFAYDIQQGDWAAFLFDTYRQVLYPPLHYWLTGLSFLIFGQSVVSAALVSLVAYILIAPTLYLSGLSVRDNYGQLTGIVAAALFLASPPLIRYATFSMLELSGLFALSIATLIYLWLTKTDAQPEKYVLLGLGILLTFFTRVPYGIMLFITVVVAELAGARFRPSRILVRRLIFLLLPMVLVLGVWFAYPPKIVATWNWLVNTPTVDTPFSVSALLYFPQEIVSFPGSIWITGLLLGSLLVSIRYVKDRRVLFLVTLVIVQFLLGEMHHTKHARFMFPVLPAMFLLTAYIIAEVWHHFRDTKNIARFWLPRVLTILLLTHTAVVFSRALDGPPIVTEPAYKVAPYVEQVTRELGTAFAIGSVDVKYPFPGLMDWYLISEAKVMDPPQAGTAIQIEEERKLAALLAEYPVPKWLVNLLQPVFTRSDQQGRTRSVQLGIPFRASYSQSAENFRKFFLGTYTSDAFDGVVVVTSTRERAKYPLDYIVPSLLEAGLFNTSSRVFEDAKTRVDVFEAGENAAD